MTEAGRTQDLSPPLVIGWDLGGAHLKACLLSDGRVADVAQWACPLWQGLDRLDAALASAVGRWPQLPQAGHAVTMTGEMADLFANREQGVVALARRLAALPGRSCVFYAGPQNWVEIDAVGRHWREIASANWLASATLAARGVDAGVLVDIGSTTTDLIPLRAGRADPQGRDDAARLASGELVYHGVVRTPLCAFARRIAFRGVERHVMNEFFATAADVYRATGELDPAHDLHPPADGGAKDPTSTWQRLARMIGLDARDATPAEWGVFAAAWREQQLGVIGAALEGVLARLRPGAPLVSAGCGAFLVAELARRLGRSVLDYASVALEASQARPSADGLPVPPPAALARDISLCAPAVAVALLHG